MGVSFQMSKAIPTPRRVRITYKIYMLLFIKKLGKAVTYKMESTEQKNMYHRSYNYLVKMSFQMTALFIGYYWKKGERNKICCKNIL